MGGSLPTSISYKRDGVTKSYKRTKIFIHTHIIFLHLHIFRYYNFDVDWVFWESHFWATEEKALYGYCVIQYMIWLLGTRIIVYLNLMVIFFVFY